MWGAMPASALARDFAFSAPADDALLSSSIRAVAR